MYQSVYFLYTTVCVCFAYTDGREDGYSAVCHFIVELRHLPPDLFFWPLTKTDEWYLTVLPSPIMCYHGVNLLNIRGGRWILLLRFLSCPLDAEVQSRGAHFKVPNIFEEHPPEECTCFGLTTERSTKEVRTASHGLWGVGQASKWETRQFTNLEHLWSESLDSH